MKNDVLCNDFIHFKTSLEIIAQDSKKFHDLALVFSIFYNLATCNTGSVKQRGSVSLTAIVNIVCVHQFFCGEVKSKNLPIV